MSEPSFQDLYDLGKSAMQIRRPRMAVEEGDVSDAIICGAATMASRIIAYASRKFLACFLDGARGQELTDLAEDRGVTRNPGAKAIGSVTLTRVSSAAGAGTILSGNRVAANPDVNGDFAAYTLDSDVVWGAFELVKTVNATCTIVGKSGNVIAGSITRHLDSVFDPTISVVNPTLFVGGAEQESDEDLRDRVRGFFLTQAKGTIEAIEFGAQNVPGVSRVTVFVDDSGVITVYVADSNGNSNPTMVAAVSVELAHWVDAGDLYFVSGGVIYTQAITLRLTVRAGVDLASMLVRVQQAVSARVGRLLPGETLVREIISGSAQEVDKEKIVKCEVLFPTADIVPGRNQLIRSSTSDIAFG